MIGIMSDSHDNLENIRAAVRLFNDLECRLVIHAGDFVAPFAARELERLSCPVKAVFGNCDGEKKGLEKTVSGFGKIKAAPYGFRFAEREFLLTHTQFSLDVYLRTGHFDVIVYGHTHKPDIHRKGKTLFINPGETGGWVTGSATVATLDPVTLETVIVSL